MINLDKVVYTKFTMYRNVAFEGILTKLKKRKKKFNFLRKKILKKEKEKSKYLDIAESLQ